MNQATTEQTTSDQFYTPDFSPIRMSAETDLLIDAFCSAQAEMGDAITDSFNEYHRSKYADFSSVVAVARPAFAEYGLAFLQFPWTQNTTVTRTLRDKDGEPVYREVFDGEQAHLLPIREDVPIVMVTVTTRLIHASNQWLEFDLSIPVILGKMPAQGIGSTIEYCRRYALKALSGIATGDDDDGNVAGGIDGPTTQREFPPDRGPNPDQQPAGRPSPTRRPSNRPGGSTTRQTQEERVAYHIDRLSNAEDIETLRMLYESTSREMDGKLTDDQVVAIKEAKNTRRQQLEMNQGTATEGEISQDPDDLAPAAAAPEDQQNFFTQD